MCLCVFLQMLDNKVDSHLKGLINHYYYYYYCTLLGQGQLELKNTINICQDQSEKFYCVLL